MPEITFDILNPRTSCTIFSAYSAIDNSRIAQKQNSTRALKIT